jgi:hypothetical protein
VLKNKIEREEKRRKKKDNKKIIEKKKKKKFPKGNFFGFKVLNLIIKYIVN